MFAAGIIEYLIRIELYNQRIHFCAAVNMLPFCSELSDIILLIVHGFYKLYYGCLIHFHTSKLHLKQGRANIGLIAITFIPFYTSKHQKIHLEHGWGIKKPKVCFVLRSQIPVQILTRPVTLISKHPKRQ